jgi:4-hydroxy-tetrahydrodipicolinate synthase
MKTLTSLRNQIYGPVFSVITPFKEDESIDYDCLQSYLSQVYTAGGRIFYVMAYNSRYSELSWDEIKELNQFVVETIKGFGKDVIAIVADPLHCSTRVSMDFCRHAKEVGADLISLIFREKFYTEDQVIKHYEMCASAADIGILIHEMPFISGKGGHTVNWPIQLLNRIADIDNVIAIKEDAKEDAYTNEVVECVKDRLAIIISGGGKRQWLRFAGQGCQAWLNGVGVFEPRLPVLFYQAYKNKDQVTLDAIIENIEVPFFEKIVQHYGWHLGIKAALEAKGMMSRQDRMPMLAIPDSEMIVVKKVMDNLDNQIKRLFL